MTPRSNALFCILALAALPACEDEHEHGHDHESTNEEACEHMVSGPAVAIVAADEGGEPPGVGSDHRRYDIRLPVSADEGSGMGSGSMEGGFEGSVVFNADEAGEHVLFFDVDAVVSVFAQDGTEVARSGMIMPVAECPEDVFHGLVYPLAVGPYTIRIGSSMHENVKLVIEEAESHDHGHD